MIARLPKLPGSFWKNIGLALRAGRGRMNSLSVGVKHGRGLRFDEGSVTAVGGRSKGLTPGTNSDLQQLSSRLFF